MRAIDADAISYESIDTSDTGRHEHYYGTGIIAVRKEDIDAMPTIHPEPYTDALKAEIKRMKRSFTICINSDYYTGYMSALSAVEGYIAQMEVTT